MKTIYPILLLFVLNTRCFSQAPVMGNISGPSIVCSVPAAGSVFSTTASNSPTSYIWSVVPAQGVNITGAGSVRTISFPNTNLYYTVYCYALNASGHSVVESFQVKVFETPTVIFSGNNVVCQGSPTNLSASSTILHSASSSLYYNWSPSASISNQYLSHVTATPQATTTYTIQVTLGNCSNTYFMTVYVANCVVGIKSADEDKSVDINVYPNPNAGTFILKSPRTERIFIIDELGRPVRQIELIANEESEIRELTPGIYFINTSFSKSKIVVTR